MNRLKKYINCSTNGVISLLMAILIVPFTMIGGALLNLARVNSASAIYDEAIANAADSTLANYDSFLRDRYGLLGVKQDSKKKPEADKITENLTKDFSSYMNENIKVLSNTYTNSKTSAKGLYPLSDPNVLLSQIQEYSKYTVPTKMIKDALPTDKLKDLLKEIIPDDVLKKFEKITGWIDNAISTVGKLMDFAKSLKDLVSTIKYVKDAVGVYDNKYNTFDTRISNFVNQREELTASKIEKDQAEEKLKNAVKPITEVEDKIKEKKQQIEDENKKGNTDNVEKLEEEIGKLNEKLDELEKDKDLTKTINKDQKKYKKALKTYNAKKSRWDNNLSNNLALMASDKEEYINSITQLNDTVSDLITCLKKVQTSYTSLKNQINKNDFTVVENSVNDKGDKNAKAILEATRKSCEDVTNTSTDLLNKTETGTYEKIKNELNKLKADVGEIQINENINGLDRNKYHKSGWDIISAEEVKNVMIKMAASLVADNILKSVKTMFKIMENLFQCAGYIDNKLGANINKNFYNDTYGGLPGEKNREAYPLAAGNAEDKALSDNYKKLFNPSASNNYDVDNNLDVATLLDSIGQQLKTISENIPKPPVLFTDLITIAKQIKIIINAVKQIFQDIGKLIDWFKNLIKNIAKTVYGKILLSGYVYYMTSDRTNYEGKALNGAKFSDSHCMPLALAKGDSIESFFALLNAIAAAIKGSGVCKSFVGAEREYILAGHLSEVGNQLQVFLIIFLIRVLCNLPAILKSTEVSELAAAANIFSWVVYLLYIIIEPLIDSILLVNNVKINFIKKDVYLTSSGSDDLAKDLSELSKIKPVSGQAEDEKEKAARESVVNDSKELTKDKTKSDKKNKDGEGFKISYSQMLFVLMTVFVSKEKMLKRMSNLIEMNANEKLSRDTPGSSLYFDLDYSYTYVRAEGEFKMNEFISLSDKAGWQSKNRVLYRGY